MHNLWVESTVVTEELERVLAAYEAALNEPDAGRRAEFAVVALADEARVFAAHLSERGPLDRAGFVADCGVVQGWRPPGARLRRRGEPDGHHGWIRFAWEVSLADGEVIEVGGRRVEGIDIVELAPEGRFGTVVMFHGVAPPGSTR